MRTIRHPVHHSIQTFLHDVFSGTGNVRSKRCHHLALMGIITRLAWYSAVVYYVENGEAILYCTYPCSPLQMKCMDEYLIKTRKKYMCRGDAFGTGPSSADSIPICRPISFPLTCKRTTSA